MFFVKFLEKKFTASLVFYLFLLPLSLMVITNKLLTIEPNKNKDNRIKHNKAKLLDKIDKKVINETKDIRIINPKNKEELSELLKQYENLELNEKNVLILIKICNIQFQEIVLKQAKLESGNFKSRMAKINNNLFGMKKPYSRETFATKKTKWGYSVYTNWVYSIGDYKLWQGFKTIKTKNYFSYLKKRGYYTDPKYRKKLKSIELKDR